MDASELLLPGVQNLLSAMLSDTWSAIRGALAHRLSRNTADDADKIAGELENARNLAVPAAGLSGSGDRREAQAFLAGYLYAMQQRYPDLDRAATSAIADVQVSGERSTVSTGAGATFVVHGDVGSAVSINEMSGDISITGRP